MFILVYQKNPIGIKIPTVKNVRICYNIAEIKELIFNDLLVLPNNEIESIYKEYLCWLDKKTLKNTQNFPDIQLSQKDFFHYIVFNDANWTINPFCNIKNEWRLETIHMGTDDEFLEEWSKAKFEQIKQENDDNDFRYIYRIHIYSYWYIS